jgi:hypothetical protein
LVDKIKNEYRSYEKNFEETYYPPVRPLHHRTSPRGFPGRPIKPDLHFKNVLNAFIIYVLSQQPKLDKRSKEIITEVLKRMAEENPFLDTYVHSLIGLTLLNIGKTEEAGDLAKLIAKNQHRDSGEFQPGKTSIVRSTGDSLKIESSALALIFLQRVDFRVYSEEIKKGMHYLLRNMKDGFFGSTQGTVLALKALTENTIQLAKVSSTESKFKISLGQKNQIIGSQEGLLNHIQNNFDLSSDKLLLQVEPLLQEAPEEQVLSIEYTFYSEEPKAADNSPLKLSVKRDTIDRVEKYHIKIKNRAATKQGMTMLGIHPPSYSKLNLNDLGQLVQDRVIDFYEIRDEGSLLLFYWRELDADEEKEVSLVLVSQFEALESDPVFVEAYLYYDKDGSVVTAKV